MLKKFNTSKTYRLLTFKELEEKPEIIKSNGVLTYPESDYYYEAMMDKISIRTFCPDHDEIYDLNELYDIVPWMCEEV